ncbi:tyrosine-type recombinase/integrase [Roseovarius sp.]
MKGKDLPAYIHRRKRDGVLLFRKRYGGRIVEVRLETQFPEGQPVPVALHLERERLLNQPAPVQPGRDMAAVIRHYVASDKYRNLKPRTAADYDKINTFLRDKIGSIEPKHIERRHVIAWRDAWAKSATPHSANYRLRILRLLLEHAIDMGLLPTDGNPAKGVREYRYERQKRAPWPQDKIAAFRAAATGRELLLFELCLGTGQRIGDVLRMKWGDIEGDGIKLRQGKTGKALWVPFTGPLRAALDDAPRRSVFILTNHRATGPWSYRGASQAVRAIREAIGAEAHDIHSLRYSAASELALAGADDETIAAVTGQSLAMVAHYTATVRQKVRALKAKEYRE